MFCTLKGSLLSFAEIKHIVPLTEEALLGEKQIVASCMESDFTLCNIFGQSLSRSFYKFFAGLSNHFLLLQVQSEEVYAHGHAHDTINQ